MKHKLSFFLLSLLMSTTLHALDFENYDRSEAKHVLITKKYDKNSFPSKHVVEIEIASKKFNPKEYKFKQSSSMKGSNCYDMMNGEPVRGLDGYCKGSNTSLYWVLDSIKITLDKKEIPIDPKWYLSFFMPFLNEKDLQVRLADDAEGIFLFLKGSDAAGYYEVVWSFRKDGHHSRYSISTPDDVGTFLRNGDLDNEDNVETNYRVLSKK